MRGLQRMIPGAALHEQALHRERAVAAGAATLAASSDRDVVQAVAAETTAELARSAGATGVRVLLGVGHDLRHEIVATAGEQSAGAHAAGAIGRVVSFEDLPEHLVAGLRRGETVHFDDDGAVLVTRLRAGGRDVGVLSVSSDTPLPPEVTAAVTSWSTQVAASLAGLTLTEELLHRAQHDPLTGLANRDLLRERLADTLGAGPADGYTALLLVDLDRLARIDDELGRRAADGVVCAVADRLRTMLQRGDVAARLSANGFGLVLTGVRDADAASAVTSKLISVLRAPIDADGHPVAIGGSIGVALRAPGSGATVDEILEDAEAAKDRARTAGAAPLPAVPRLSVAS